MVARGKKGGKGQAKECTYADFEKALKVGETLTFDATNGVLTGVKITGPANRTRAKKRVGVRSV